jgi:hypothetical protein
VSGSGLAARTESCGHEQRRPDFVAPPRSRGSCAALPLLVVAAVSLIRLRHNQLLPGVAMSNNVFQAKQVARPSPQAADESTSIADGSFNIIKVIERLCYFLPSVHQLSAPTQLAIQIRQISMQGCVQMDSFSDFVIGMHLCVGSFL